MANPAHESIIKQGVIAWNQWRSQNPSVTPDLSKASLSGLSLAGANLSHTNLVGCFLGGHYTLQNQYVPGVDLSNADFTGADLRTAQLYDTKLSGAVFENANMREVWLGRVHLLSGNVIAGADASGAIFNRADMTRAKLEGVNVDRAEFVGTSLNGADLSFASLIGSTVSGADLTQALLLEADFTNADLVDTQLVGAMMVRTNLEGARMEGCSVYGVSVWDVQGRPREQTNFLITPIWVPEITTDNLEVAQFIYLLINNEKIRDVIQTVTSKVVLILGRFTDERRMVLNALRDELRNHNLTPVLFDFDPSMSRDVTETVSLLAHMARFIVADITDPRSIPQELQTIVPNLPSVPIRPIIHVSGSEYGMFEHFKRYPWVLDVHQYDDSKELINSIKAVIIDPAESKRQALLTSQGTP